MKTKIQWTFILAISALLSGACSVFAQAPTQSQIAVREQQAKRVDVYQQIIDLQNSVALINQAISEVQALIQERQASIAELNTAISATTDANLISTYQQKIQSLNNEINNDFQSQITLMQTKLAGIPGRIALIQADVDAIDANIAMAQALVAKETAYAQQQQQQQNAPPVSLASQQPQATGITAPRDPSNPQQVPLFRSTGDAVQDATIVRQWLLAHPIVR
jgi:predicted  nucleic acid-binding Zn-ribbon protein